ncbi:MAG TPA: diguanylate cyclase [Gaiellaceae bacterium]|nr:diguanylate cyclase [Gaiellaceae bacterium]
MLREIRRAPGPARGAPCAGRPELFAALAFPAEPADREARRLLLVADVDGFRGFNARHGYAAGDEVLRQLGARVAELAPTFRAGGDVFAVLLEGTPLELTRGLADVLDALAVEHPEPLHCSLGCALLQPEAHGAAAFALAEQRLEDQKRRGLVFADRVAEVLLAVMGAHDEGLRRHGFEVAALAEAVSGRLGLAVAERALVRRTAELHDIGKLALPRAVLEKPGPLDAAEWEQMRRHTLLGEDLLALFAPLASVAALVRATHERYDGDGYPDGRQADEIPLAARIVAVCDAYHAMCSDRPYAPTRSGEDARVEIEVSAGSHFDPVVVSAIAAELGGPRLSAVGGDFEDASLDHLARLHGLLESASVVEDADDLPRALEAVARVVGESLDYGGVVINLYRHEWDDFVVSTVYGDDPALRTLLGSTYDWAIWERLLDPRFLRSGAYTVYAGDYDWGEQSGHRVVPDLDTGAHPDAWQAEDEIFVPFHHTDGHILGIFNVALPRSGLRPSEDDLRLLTTVVRHAARAVQRAQEMAAAAAHRRALEHLLRVSSKLTQTASKAAVLDAISAGISGALGFERVVVYLHDRETGALTPAAAAGFALDDPRLQLPFGLAELQTLFEEQYETEGCYLVPLEQAQARLPQLEGTYHSTSNGRGPWAWRRHWLAVPMLDRRGACAGVIFADDPVDRLLPTTERLQALRLFANQATVALESVAQYEAQRYLAEHDALTGLRNRHSFMAELQAGLLEARKTGKELALVYCDLDGFKQLNDACGHTIGDAALVRFASVLADSVRSVDTAYRIGGDEFAVLMRGCNEDGARGAVERALSAWSAEPKAAQVAVNLDASFGVAMWRPQTGGSVEELLRRADEAMYEAKRSQSRLTVAA